MKVVSNTMGSASGGRSICLWGVIAVLAATSFALGASLWRERIRNAPLPEAQSLVADAVDGVAASRASAAPSGARVKSAQISEPKALQAKKATDKPPEVATNEPKVSASGTAPEVAKASKVCASCGTVVSVKPVEKPGEATGVGAVAGAALGGVLGNQIGGGDGKKVATILGAVGGGIAGNAVEKRMKQTTRYEVSVRMDDGSLRTIEQANLAVVGELVTIDGDTLYPRR